MKYYLTLILLILPSITLASKSSSWYFDRAINGVEFWKNDDFSKCLITAQKLNESNSQTLDYFLSDNFTKNMQDKKKLTLGILGLENWTVQINKTYEINKEVRVEMSGDYTDMQKIKLIILNFITIQCSLQFKFFTLVHKL